MKYKEWLHDWLELYEKESVKPRTYKQYENVINKRLIPALGDYEIPRSHSNGTFIPLWNTRESL